MQQPTIGRIVHYKVDNGIVRPAIITDVDGVELTLTVFGMKDTDEGVKTTIIAEGPRTAVVGDCWWPERL